MTIRYVSTRGGVPPCDFEEALLAGLAADGGLYLPERWPRLDATSWRRCRARPTRRSRRACLAPFVDGDLARPTLRELIARGVCRLRPRRRWRRCASSGQRLAARAVPRADARLQGHRPAAAGPAVRAFARRAAGAITIVGATSGDTGSAAIEACAGRARMRIVDPASARAHLRGAAPADDHGRRRQRPQHRDRGHLRRLPGAA